MALQKLNLTITSEAPLLLHNGQTADSLNRFSKQMKQVTSKRAKTDADFEELARIEWYASLYMQDGKVCLPAEVLEAAFANGAKKLKLGKQAQATLFVTHNAQLHFDGDDMSVDELWKRDQNRFTVGVRVGQNKVMRTRFRTDDWSCDVGVQYDDKMLNKAQIIDIIKATGEQVGLCDWRPKFGRFSVEVNS